MQIRTKRIGRLEALKQDLVIITPDGADPLFEHGPLAVSYTPGSRAIMLYTNCPVDPPANLIGIDAIRHMHEALGEVLARFSAEPPVPLR